MLSIFKYSIIPIVAFVGFEMQNITVQESSGEVTFHVLKSGLAAVQLSVLFTTEDLEAMGKTVQLATYHSALITIMLWLICNACSSTRLYSYNKNDHI